MGENGTEKKKFSLISICGRLLDRLQAVLSAAVRLVFSARSGSTPFRFRFSAILIVAGPEADHIPSAGPRVPLSQRHGAVLSG